jgi:hypothetical protein
MLKKYTLKIIISILLILTLQSGTACAETDETSKILRINGNTHVRALGNRLSTQMPACILVLGDSTGNETNEWVFTTSQWLASQFPNYTFSYRLWNDTSQSYDMPINIQTGTNGDACAVLPGGVGNNISAPDSVNLRITGDIEIIAKIASDVWTSGVQTFISKIGGAGQRGWYFGMEAGRPFLWWSPDGTAVVSIFATSIPAYTNGQAKWLKATLDVDNGNGGHTATFYTSSNGDTWTQLGNAIIKSGATSIYGCTALVEIGSRTWGTEDIFVGKVYEVIVKSGIDGKIVASPDFGMSFPSIVKTFSDAENNTWAINGNATNGNGAPEALILNASKPGAGIGYSSNETRFALLTPIKPQLAFISYGHNEWTDIDYQSTYEELAAQLLTKYPNVGVVCVTQNPQKAPQLHSEHHALRNMQVAEVAAKNNYGLVDVFRAFMDTGDFTNYVSVDGCHPTQAGFDLWRDEAIKFLLPATNN